MGAFVPAADWASALKYAGRSDARQVRQILPHGTLIAPDIFPFLRLFGGSYKEPGKDAPKVIAPVIRSNPVKTLTPELYDDEVAPINTRLAATTSAIDVGDSATITVDSSAGYSVGDIINNIKENAQGRVTAIPSTTSLTITVIYSPAGSQAWVLDDSIAYLEKLGNAQGDAPTAGNGNNREPINRVNNLQFGLVTMSEGVLQSQLSLYAAEGMEPDSGFKREKRLKMMDSLRQREMAFLFGRKTSTGTGASRILTMDGLLALAGTVYENANAGGVLPWDDFARGLMPTIRTSGGGNEVWGLCGNDVAATFTSYAQLQNRVTTEKNQYMQDIQVISAPSGTLKLLVHEAFQSEARRGQMLCFQPRFLTRAFLRNMDFQFVPDLENGSEFLKRAAYMWVESLLASNPNSISLVTNVLGGA